jgi:O-acetyl-ADP-ribose deacetylase (regulator of RNase III)
VLKISYLKGDATCPQAKGQKIIAHVCNDIGGWGRGFVLALSAKWPEPEASYREWYNGGDGFALGKIQVVRCDQHTSVANMVAQHGVKAGSKGPPIRYDALDECLAALAEKALADGASVHMPRIGCGLAGGKWDKVEPLLVERLCKKDVGAYVYDLGG